MHYTVWARYPYELLHVVLSIVLNLKQQDGECLTD